MNLRVLRNLQKRSIQAYLMTIEMIIALSSLAASGITGIIAFLLYKQNQNLSKQTLALETEQKNRQRPWIKIIPNEYQQTSTKVLSTLKLKNIGQMPAKTVYSKIHASLEQFDKNELWKKGVKKSVMPLLPNEIQPFIVDLDKDFLKKTKTHPMYFGIHVAYDTADGFKTIGKIWKDTGDTRHDLDYWIDEEPTK